MRQFFFQRLLTAAYIVLLLTGTSAATELPTPKGPVLLTVYGNITNHNAGKTAQFDMQMLEQLPPTSFTTNTPWTEGATEFTGARISDILAYVGAGSSDFQAVALDKYEIDVTDISFEDIPAIIAYKKNGKPMRIRELGPLWIMFPFDDYPKIVNEKHKNACVWQLIELTVK